MPLISAGPQATIRIRRYVHLMKESRQASRRMASYGVIFVVLLAGAGMLHRLVWQANRELHTLLETVATLLALVAGANALIRFYTRKTTAYLIMGTGLAGVALLGGYHAVITPTLCSACTHSSLSPLTPWRRVVCRLFSCIVMC